MSGVTEEFQDLCAGYLAGALSPEDEKQFKSEMSTASQEQLYVFNELLEASLLLPEALDEVQPSLAVKEQILAIPEAARSGFSLRRLFSFLDPQSPAFAAAIPMVLVVALIFAAYSNYNNFKKVEQITAQLEAEKSKNFIQEFLQRKSLSLVSLKGLEASPEAQAKVFFDGEKNEVLLQVANLPAPPAGKVYQLWMIPKVEGGSPIGAGTLNNHSSQTEYFELGKMNIAAFTEIKAFAVTLEPEGGSAQPTGPMVLLGST